MIEIRAVAADEFTSFEDLFVLYQEFYEVEDIDRERNREFFSRFLVDGSGAGSADGWLLGAFDGDTPVGFGCFYRHKSSLTATNIVLMNDLYVVEGVRGGGIGRKLIEAGIELARDWGGSHLAWATAPDNATAQRLYDSTDAHKSTWIEYEIEV